MAERRQEQRQGTLRSGKIIFNNRQSVIDCIIRDLSNGGTCLQVNSTENIPEAFELLPDGDNDSRPCQIVWMSGTRIGVEFRSPASYQTVFNQDLSGKIATADITTDDSSESSSRNILRGNLVTFWAVLDKVPFGIVLLDHECRAQFINRAFRQMWRLPDAKADSKPPFVALMYHGRDTRAYAIPSGDLDAYIAARVEHVKSGDSKPLDLRLVSGETIRLQCIALPNGGRVLCYTYVTDIVAYAEELQALRAALDNIQQGIILLDPMLNAQFMNRAIRDIWKVSDEQANRKPPFIELVVDARKTGTFDGPPDELGNLISNCVAVARAGDPAPMDMPHSNGRTIRSQCAILPNGGRMLTYTDVTDLVHRAAQFEELANFDGLTGVYNRRQFNALADIEWSRFQRYYRPLSVLLLDIDRFKQINDQFGHEVGDRVIMHIATLCKECTRSSDIIGRVGGDEFIVLLPETNLTQVRNFAERLRNTILQTPARHFSTDCDDIAVTVSIGVAEAAVGMSSFGTLMKAAGQALYRAKSTGQNQVVAHQPIGSSEQRAAAE